MKMKKSLLILGIIMLSTISSLSGQGREDWAGLRIFREANAKAGLPGAGEKRVVFMGNSITEAWIEDDPGFFAGRPYINRGISGQTSPQMLLRFRADVIALKPAVVIILAGINDIAGNTGPSTLEMIMDNIASMAELAGANGIVPILCSVLPAFECQWNPGQEPAEKVVELNRMIQSYASAHGILSVDYYSPMVDERKGLKAAYAEDEVHPNLAGYKVMEPLAEKAIEKALNMK
jgi:lysophospholipase L1-like esterase